jgi:serine/threonine-protein kinase RsbW
VEAADKRGPWTLNLNLSIPGDVKEIDPAVEKIMWVLGEVGCAADKEFEIETALREALANAIVHGCSQNPSQRVQLLVACGTDHSVTLVVRDPGRGFDPQTIPNPLESERVLAVHGRGIYLINQLMDDVRFKRGGTEIHMRKK